MSEPTLGLKQNYRQFWLLVLVNAFVGAMVGLERSIFPSLAKEEFGLEATTAILSFIIVFGLTKAISNYYAGSLANSFGRKKVLLLGWLAALPVPLILMYTHSWNGVILANVFLGINQGLAWSSTVNMKIDLVGPKRRGFAMGLNEFAGYIAVALVSYFTAEIALSHGLRPYPFYLGLGISVLGLLMSVFFVRETQAFVQLEAESNNLARQKNTFIETTFKNKNLSAITQAGMVNNLNDGMMWGLLPIYMLSLSFDLGDIAWVSGIYPAIWGVCQLFTGAWGDKYSKKTLLFVGMMVQGIAIQVLSLSEGFVMLMVCAVLLGFGTAMVYPTFLSGIADYTHPLDRAKSIGVFRLWRDSGYAIGAIISSTVATYFSASTAISVVGGITVLSALVIQFRMSKN